MLANLSGSGIGKPIAPRLTDLIKNGVGILGCLLQFRAEFAFEWAAIGMNLAVDIAYLVNDGNPPPCQAIDMKCSAEISMASGSMVTPGGGISSCDVNMVAFSGSMLRRIVNSATSSQAAMEMVSARTP